MSQKVIGIDLGGTTTKLGIIDDEGTILQQWSIATDCSGEGKQIIPNIIASIKHRMDLYQLTPQDFSGIGMGAPGNVDPAAGTVIGAYNLNWTEKQFVRKQITAALRMEVAIENDANVAALGEQWRGAGENDPNVVFITLGTGVGGGIITNGQLVRGTAGNAGEIGHIGAVTTGFSCTCGGRGCLETVASATGIVNLGRYLSEGFAGDSQLKYQLDSGQDVSCKDIFAYAQADDAFALMVVEKVCDYLGTACGNIANILNPSSIILGGGVSAAGEFLREQVETYFMYTAFPQVQESTKIKLATIGNDAGIIGAASLVFHQ